jgi:2-succinyl-6-hydroxy-2,4-cyclohexadiene-1-carboxylate synthase
VRRSPLVLLHGFTGAPASYDATRRNLGTYQPELIYAPYLVGHGPDWTSRQGASVTGTPPFEAEVSALSEQLLRLGVTGEPPAVLVGYSLGARLALGLLLMHPQHFARCVLIGVNPGVDSTNDREARRQEDALRAERLVSEGLEAFLLAWQNQSLFESQRALDQTVLAQQGELRRTNTARGLARSLERTGLGEMPNYAERLRTVPTPVHLVVGERDVKFRAIAQRMVAFLPHAELTVVPNVGHNVPLEAPQILAALLDALPED